MIRGQGMSQNYGSNHRPGPLGRLTGRKSSLSHAILNLLIVPLCLHFSASIASSLPTEELLDLIDQGQRHNLSRISPLTGIASIHRVLTPEGQRFEAAEREAAGEKVPFRLQGPYTKPLTTVSYSSKVCFDGESVRWGEPSRSYAYNGKTAYEYVPGNKIPYAYIIDPKKIASGRKTCDPRCWTAVFSDGTLGDWLKRIPTKYTLKIEEVKQGENLAYQVRLEYESGFVRAMRIDPQRGYQITESSMIDNHGQPRQKIVVDFVKSPAGGWMPRKRAVQYYRILRQNEPAALTRTDESVLEKFEFGPVPEKEFSLDGLGVPIGTLVMDELTDTDFVFGVPAIDDRIISEAIEGPDVQQVLAQQKSPQLNDILPPEPDSPQQSDARSGDTPGANTTGSAAEDANAYVPRPVASADHTPAFVAAILLLAAVVIVLSLLLLSKHRRHKPADSSKC
ncbi:MAG: hypothetical protein JSU94_07955 [Phycisphaerales bacterium]|nr:MAG: hypothetical protein JSU94_07955 [Phycisphaerales bacterium]